MPTDTYTNILDFHPLTLDDKQAVQAITLHSGRRNCNLNFANLIGWQFLFDTEVCILPDTVVIRYLFNHTQPAYIISAQETPSPTLIVALQHHAALSGHPLSLYAIENHWAETLHQRYGDTVTIEPLRNSYDYIYRRSALELLQGKTLKSKRNHVNKFINEHPNFEYIDLAPEHFDMCRQLEQKWRTANHHDNPWYGNTIESEQQMMENIFTHWNDLDMRGGAVFVDGRMVAFSCGAPVTIDTFDTCIEKADRSIDGAFNIINQQFALHLPSQYKYINREEDMGLQGLRKAKLSYHPEILLSYNIVTFTKP
ncbi:MAG: DUF2156 domain-containing protein [Bacteroidales bacterium]|nr:DUF2156 domain-containing protein [Bacteroidales bacterium]